MCAPLFIKNYEYLTENGGLREADLFAKLAVMFQERYREYNQTVNIAEIFTGKTEDQIFEVYRELILIDKFGFLVPLGTTLVNIGESEKKLNELIGLSGIKESIKKIKAYALANRGSKDLNIHMCFLGNPGTGKTEVARYIAGILYENKILPTNKVVEVDRSGLVSQYFGATAEKTSRVIASAMGGVLFIDEAYALSGKGENDYGQEAIETLLKAMEDHRDELVVIVAGYTDEMSGFILSNPGLESRFNRYLHFPDYSLEEMVAIFQMRCEGSAYTLAEDAKPALWERLKRETEGNDTFGNARGVRNLFERVLVAQANRLAVDEDITREELMTLTAEDIQKAR